MFPQTRGSKPIPRANRYRFTCVPGWSPSRELTITPAAAARTPRIGPSVASSSALMNTCLPWSMAAVATLAPYSVVPVASMIASISSDAQSTSGSLVTTGRPARIAASSDATSSTTSGASVPQDVHALDPVINGPVGDAGQALAGGGGDELASHASTQGSGSHEADLDRVAGGGARLQGTIDDDHVGSSARGSIGQPRSLSEMCTAGSGQAMARAGSSKRSPRSCSGLYAPDTR